MIPPIHLQIGTDILINRPRELGSQLPRHAHHTDRSYAQDNGDQHKLDVVIVYNIIAEDAVLGEFGHRVFHLPDLYNPIRQQAQVTDAQPDELECILAA
jgi:hypothetical protein